MKECPKCHNNHDKPGTFCSRKCANGKVWSAADRLKKSIAAKASSRVMDANRSRTKPPIPKPQRMATPKPTGGYREGSGRGKKGYIRGVYCASTYELVWVLYRLDHDLPVVRFPGFIQMGESKYYPDFIDGNTIIEIKGYWTPSVDSKRIAAECAGYVVVLLYKKDLQFAFDWVRQHYTYVDVTELYDDHVPCYTYTCSSCSKIFGRRHKAKTDVVYCSRQCAGHRNRKNNPVIA